MASLSAVVEIELLLAFDDAGLTATFAPEELARAEQAYRLLL